MLQEVIVNFLRMFQNLVDNIPWGIEFICEGFILYQYKYQDIIIHLQGMVKCSVSHSTSMLQEIVSIIEKFEASLIFYGVLNMHQNLFFDEQRHQLPQWFRWTSIQNFENATISPSPLKLD